MAKVRVNGPDDLEAQIHRFSAQCGREEILEEYKRKMAFVSRKDRRKAKDRAARQRKARSAARNRARYMARNTRY